jgi:hypothetical protein
MSDSLGFRFQLQKRRHFFVGRLGYLGKRVPLRVGSVCILSSSSPDSLYLLTVFRDNHLGIG